MSFAKKLRKLVLHPIRFHRDALANRQEAVEVRAEASNPSRGRANRFLTLSKGLEANPLLPIVLEGAVEWHEDLDDVTTRPTAVIGAGKKDKTLALQEWARQRALPYLAVEDGFIRSLGLGVRDARQFGFVVDGLGIYYDATQPSQLERLIQEGGPCDLVLASRLRALVVQHDITKYNHSQHVPRLPERGRKRVLVVDQTAGDMSIRLGLATAESFTRMLDAAVAENPDADIYIKSHPDVICGAKEGHLGVDNRHGVPVLAEDGNSLGILKQFDRVYCVTSQMGFEALLVGKEVRCFGMPFYAGWGVTQDTLTCHRRTAVRSVDELFWWAYGVYTRYVDPLSRQLVGLEAMLARLITDLDQRRKLMGDAYLLGFSAFKRDSFYKPVVPEGRAYLLNQLTPRMAAQIGASDRVIAWSLAGEAASALLPAGHRGFHRMEDGFIRSVGLGVEKILPRSFILDRLGIYFDPSRPSDLEQHLAEHPFNAAESTRGQALIERLRSAQIGKYNVGCRTPLILPRRDRPVVLVPGQVEDDRSILTGGGTIRTNLGLLQAVRRQHPDATILYKPHPDVLTGKRIGQIPAGTAREYCDVIVTRHAMSSCLAVCDEICTMTSLTGFEGLIQGKRVTCYGLPFYAGWGLTTDHLACPRRGRRLALPELVFATLVLYPFYYDWALNLFISPEDLIAQLAREVGP